MYGYKPESSNALNSPSVPSDPVMGTSVLSAASGRVSSSADGGDDSVVTRTLISKEIAGRVTVDTAALA